MNQVIDNLDKLTEDLYKKLVQDAQTEIDALKSEAEKERAKLIEEAKTEADSILKEATREAERIKESSLQELRQESLQLKSTLQGDLESFLQEEVISKPLGSSFKDEQFISKLVEDLLQNFDSKSFKVQWPQKWDELWLRQIQEKLPQWSFAIADEDSLKIENTSKGMEFRLGPQEFEQLLKKYFNERLRKMIFNHD